MNKIVNLQDPNAPLVADPETQEPGKDCAEKKRRRGRAIFGSAALLLLIGGLALGVSRSYSQQQLVMSTAEQIRNFVPNVRVVSVGVSPRIVIVTLPATTAAFADANIYARATGYIAKRNVDIGDRVNVGDLLVQLAVPELDHQISENEATLVQLKAALEQARANLDLAEVTWNRDRPLVRDGWATQQQGTVDTDAVKAQTAAVSVARANVTAQENLLEVLRQNRDYALVTAPFDGVITKRNIDVGSLVQGNATGGTFMFTIMQSDVIRVWVYVPQDSAFGLTPGVDAVVRVPEIPNRAFHGKVTRIARALETSTRTLLTEIDIPNPDGALQPGAYCLVDLDIPTASPSLLIPADATIFNRDGIQVAVVDDGTVHIHKVSVTRDLGTQLEVDGGVKPGEQVIINPSITLAEGSKVRIRNSATAPKT